MKAFDEIDPVAAAVYFVSVMLVGMFISAPMIQLFSLLGAAAFCLIGGRGEIKSDLGFYIPMFIMIALINPLFSHNGVTPLFFLNGNPVTLEAVIYGIVLAVMMTGILLWCRNFTKVMTSDKLLYIMGRAVPALSLTVSMALRFVPMFKRQMKKVSAAQKGMGLYSSKSYTDRIRGALRVFAAMVSWSLENAMETSCAMKARGYGLKGRTNFAIFRFTLRDCIFTVTTLLLLAAVIGGYALGYIDFYYYPRISAADINAGSAAVYVSFAVMAFLPFMIEVKEALKWKYFVSKI